jgi:2-succinyl-6-hydroxy-2,4-cyclohexadiene-1-carboxylate synthase
MSALVLFHGFTGSPASWDAFVERLSGRNIVRPALLGHGAPEPPATSFQGEVERLAALLPAEEPVHLAGYSLGARLALCVALHRPEAVKRLTLVSGHPGLRSEADRRERRANDGEWQRLLGRGIEPFVDAWEAQPLFAGASRLDASVREARRRERLSHDPAGLARSLSVLGLAEMPDCWPNLSRLAYPVTLMVGELDQKFLALGREAVALLPQGSLRIVPGAGHDLLLERPDLVASILEKDEDRPGR